jgi:hypothetical protein
MENSSAISQAVSPCTTIYTSFATTGAELNKSMSGPAILNKINNLFLSNINDEVFTGK